MAYLRALLVVLVSVVGVSYCSYVETLNKCSVHDKGCHKNLIQKVLKDIGKNGIPELKMPPIDPVEVKNVNMSIFNIVELILKEGSVKGITNCIVDSTNVDIDHLHASIQLTCDVTIKGKYVVKSSSDFVKNLLGGEVHGEGNGKCKIYKITVKLDFPFKVVKRGEDYFLTSDNDKYKYSFNIHDKVVFFADNIYLGEKESSKEVTQLMNENWKTIIETFGNHFMDIAMKFVREFVRNFFDNVPCKHYLTDDVSSYV